MGFHLKIILQKLRIITNSKSDFNCHPLYNCHYCLHTNKIETLAVYKRRLQIISLYETIILVCKGICEYVRVCVCKLMQTTNEWQANENSIK